MVVLCKELRLCRAVLRLHIVSTLNRNFLPLDLIRIFYKIHLDQLRFKLTSVAGHP